MSRTRPRPISALRVAAALAFAQRGPIAQQLVFTPYHASGIYDVGQAVGWTVTFGPVAPAYAYGWSIHRNNAVILKEGKLDLASGKDKIEITCDQPEMITAVLVCGPAGADADGDLHGRKAVYPNWPSDDPDAMKTALYFDTVNFASRIKAPVLAGIGFIDTISPPAGIWTAEPDPRPQRTVAHDRIRARQLHPRERTGLPLKIEGNTRSSLEGRRVQAERPSAVDRSSCGAG